MSGIATLDETDPDMETETAVVPQEPSNSFVRYKTLAEALKRVRATYPMNSAKDEDPILREMADLWFELTDDEQEALTVDPSDKD